MLNQNGADDAIVSHLVQETNAHAPHLHEEAMCALSEPAHHEVRFALAEASAAAAKARVHVTAPGANQASSDCAWIKKEDAYLKRDQVLVLQGDTFDSIAKKTLALRGEDRATSDQIKDEADRIRQLNMKYYSEFGHCHRVSAGMILDVSEPRIGPDVHHGWLQWADAKERGTTYVHRGERVVAMPGTQVVVEPGGAALVNEGASAYAFPGSHVEAFGGVTISSGADVTASENAVVVQYKGAGHTKPLQQEAALNPELFPRG
jgi:hypothetical protein